MNKNILIFIGVGILILGLGIGGYFFLIPRCPESCDDGNPCTQDICSKETNYKCSYTKLIGPQPECSAEVTCGKETCKAGVCQMNYISDCCGNKICEVGEAYEDCPVDCPNCDDNNECTKDDYDYHEHKCVNTPILDVVCCGNTLCEIGETYKNCVRDCLNCDDEDKCTRDTYNYHEQKCINEIIIPCCGNKICDEGVETFSDCQADCPNCDDDNELTGDSFNYETQECEYVTYYFYEDFNDGFASWLPPNWSIIFPEDGMNGIATNRGETKASANLGDRSWTNYALRLKVKIEQGAVNVYVRAGHGEGAYAYGVAISENSLRLWKDTDPSIDLQGATGYPFSLSLNQFHDIKIGTKGNNIKVYVNDTLEIDYTDTDNPILDGHVRLSVYEKAYFDDIIVEAPR